MPVHVGRFATSAAAATLAATLLGVSPGAVWAHGAGADQLTTLSALTSWTLEPLALLGILAAAAVYLAAVRRVDRVHRLNPVPRRRTAAWLAGLLVVAVALFSFLDVYAGQLFSVHMVQHILLTMVAAPLLVLGAPVTLLLRALPRGWRTRRAMPILESAPLRLLAHPGGGWAVFAGGVGEEEMGGGIMWAVGDMLFLVPLLFLTAAWLRSEEEKGRLHDERLDRERPVRPPLRRDRYQHVHDDEREE